MVGRGELTEEAWHAIAPLLPSGGGRRGGRWRDLPERYGAWQTCADRLSRWRRDGAWDRVLAQVQTRSDVVGEVVWEVSVDSSTARAHHHASGARRRPSQADLKRGSRTRRMRDSGVAGED